jgi:hypothetical protein
MGGIDSRSVAATNCASLQAELATFTCQEEWTAAAGIARSNDWLCAIYDGVSWKWSSGEPFAFVPPGPFDGSAPQAGAGCLWRDQGGTWLPQACATRGAGAYCERGPH